MHKSRLACLVIDCKGDDLDAAAAFWGAALGHEPGPIDDPQNGHYRQLTVPEGQPLVLVQKVNHESRVHLDIETDDIEAEALRLEALGARRVEAIKTWLVMEAPTGQRFCLVKPQRKDFASGANEWD